MWKLGAIAGVGVLFLVAGLIVAGTRVSFRLSNRLSIRSIPIFYGMPAPDAKIFEAVEQGQIELAGCVVPIFPKRRRIIIEIPFD
jgi:hypothetical protein